MKQIDIKELIHFMRDGWVAMDKDGDWYWFEEEPHYNIEEEVWMLHCCQNPRHEEICLPVCMSTIKPVSNWTKSLIRIDESQNNFCITDE
jgi:hypothetical protein